MTFRSRIRRNKVRTRGPGVSRCNLVGANIWLFLVSLSRSGGEGWSGLDGGRSGTELSGGGRALGFAEDGRVDGRVDDRAGKLLWRGRD